MTINVVRVRGGLVTALLLVTGVIALPSPVAAATSCAVNGTTATVAFTPHGGTFPVDNTSGHLMVAFADCGVITLLDTVNIDLGGGIAEINFDLKPGPLGPANNGQPVLAFVVDNAGQGSGLGVFGTDGDDSIAAGEIHTSLPTFTFKEVLDLDVATESTPHNDVSFHPLPESVQMSGRGGNDTLEADHSGLASTPTPMRVDFLGGIGSDTLVGGSGGDFADLSVPDQGDSFRGGAGIDTANYSSRTTDTAVSLDDTANDGQGCTGGSCEGDNIHSDVERVFTGSGNDHLSGSGGADFLCGLSGTNVVRGGGGDDVLASIGGSDDLLGGPGFDTASYEQDEAPVDVTLDGISNDGPNSEDDVHGDVEAIVGGPGNDHLAGNGAANRLYGGLGDDLLRGLGGDDLLDGGDSRAGPTSTPDGSDDFSGGPGIDTVTEAGHTGGVSLSIDGVANDIVIGAAPQGVDNIRLDVENVIGGPGNDVITGSATDNRIVGGRGRDTLSGLGGDDVLMPGPGIDKLNGGPDLDTVSFSDASAAINVSLNAGTASGAGADTLTGIESAVGSRFGDTIVGSAGRDNLTGGAGDDTLRGLGGNDVISGGLDDDTLNGGPGTDTCSQGPGTGSVTACEH